MSCCKNKLHCVCLRADTWNNTSLKGKYSELSTAHWSPQLLVLIYPIRPTAYKILNWQNHLYGEGQCCPHTDAVSQIWEEKDSTARCGKKSIENLLGSWHVNTQKSSSAADYQFSTQPVRGGCMTQLQKYVYIYRPLRLIWPLSSTEKARAKIAQIKAPFHFSTIPILRQG